MKTLVPIGLALMIALLSVACSKSAPEPTTTSPAQSAQPAFDHQPLDALLAQYVDKEGWVDYAGLKNERAKLDQYLATLASAKPQDFPNETERLAFWINSYNAFTLADVLDDVYGKAKSVKDVKGFFDQKKHQIAGAELTLDEIEKRGRDLNDPRIHFAVNCASASCPKLQQFAYTGTQLDYQLTKAAREFLGDSGRGMNYDAGRNQVYLSPIFKWYAADFTGANPLMARVKAEVSGAEMLEVAKKYMPPDAVNFLTAKNVEVKWLEYNWALNVQEVEK
jgi:hypothetical protein